MVNSVAEFCINSQSRNPLRVPLDDDRAGRECPK